MVSKQPPVANSKTVNPGWGQHAASFTKGIEWDCRSSKSCDWTLSLIRLPEICMLPLEPIVPEGSTPDKSGGHLGFSMGPQGSPSAFVALGDLKSGGRAVTARLSSVPGFNLDLSRDRAESPPVLGDRRLVVSSVPTVVGCGEAPGI